jgi:anti-anti-sigma regulatory factor
MSAARLRLVVRGEKDPTIVLSGELDLSSLERLRAVASGVNHGPHHVTFDLREVSFVDVAGLGALSKAVAGLVSDGHRVTVLQSASVTWLLGKLEAAGCPVTIGGGQSTP